MSGRKPPKDRTLTREELRVWHYVTQQDRLLPHAEINWPTARDPAETPLVEVPACPQPSDEQLAALMSHILPGPKTQPASPPVKKGIGRRTLRRLKQGALTIESTLDLHGMNRETAWRNLAEFLEAAHTQKKRCVLVITGKGRFRAQAETRESGVLRRELPHWLAQPPCAAWVTEYAQADVAHGGDGAFYIFLRRPA